MLTSFSWEIERTPFWRGRLWIFQPKQAFRFGIDALLLSHFVELKKRDRVLEIGAGPGIISFILALKFSELPIFALEREALYVHCLSMGIRENSLEGRVFPIKGDLRYPPFPNNSFEVIIANPPYFAVGRGKNSPYPLKDIAKRDIFLNLEELLHGARKLLQSKGRFYLIFNALRTAELIRLLYQYGLTPKVLRFVHSYPGAEARLVLVKAQKQGGEEVRILPPLYLYEKRGGDYTAEVKAWLTGP